MDPILGSDANWLKSCHKGRAVGEHPEARVTHCWRTIQQLHKASVINPYELNHRIESRKPFRQFRSVTIYLSSFTSMISEVSLDLGTVT